MHFRSGKEYGDVAVAHACHEAANSHLKNKQVLDIGQ